MKVRIDVRITQEFEVDSIDLQQIIEIVKDSKNGERLITELGATWQPIESSEMPLSLDDRFDDEVTVKILDDDEHNTLWDNVLGEHWTCTDPTENIQQFGRKLAHGIYEYKEKDRDGQIIQKVIDLSKYDQETKEDVMRSYGYMYDQEEEKYIDVSGGIIDDMIIAEALFETGLFQ